MSNKNPLNKRIANISMAGQSSIDVVERGSTNDDTIAPQTYIHLHEVELRVSGITTLRIMIGDQAVFERTSTAAAEYHIDDDDMFTTEQGADLRITCSPTVNVEGFMRYSLQ